MGELIIHGDGTQRVLTFCSITRAWKYLLQGSSGYVAYVTDSRVVERKKMGDVPIVQDFPTVFPEDLPRAPPEKWVELQFKLVQGASPIAKVSYHLAPPEIIVYAATRVVRQGIHQVEQFNVGST